MRKFIYSVLIVLAVLHLMSCDDSVKKQKVESVEFEKTELALLVGQSEKLVFTTTPNDAEITLIVWSVSDENVVSVSQDGMVTGLSEGIASVTVSVEGVEATCNVTVSDEVPVEIESIEIDSDDFELFVGGQKSLNVIIKPEGAVADLIWTSDDESVATVQNGLVTAVSEGYVKISVSAGELTDDCYLTVKEQSGAPLEIVLNKRSIVMEKDNTFQLEPTLNGGTSLEVVFQYCSDNSQIATVSETGLISALTPGETRIRVKVESLGLEATCTVGVIDPSSIKSEWKKYELFDVPGYGKGIVINVTYSTITVMSLEYGRNLQWAKDPSVYVGNNADKKAYDAVDGIRLTAMIGEKAEQYPGNFPAYDWVKSLGENWYLPSPKELLLYCDTFGRKDLNPILEEMGIELLPDTIWSCVETNRTPYIDAGFLEYDSSWQVVENTKMGSHDCIALMKLKYK